jgi:hypothetical protein
MTATALIYFGIVATVIAVIIFFLCFDADDRFVETLVLAGACAAVGFLFFLLLVGATEAFRLVTR